MSTQSSMMDKIKEVMQYAIILAVGLGIGIGAKEGWAWYNTPAAFVETDTSAHFANINEKVVVYSTSWCQFCKKTREYLIANNIPFEDRDIEKGDAAIDQLYQSIGAKAIPQIVVGNKIISGFNQVLLAQELKALKLL
jgi:glutaredoxin